MNKLFLGAIFDMDGVLTDTSALHEDAWREVLGGYYDLTHAAFIEHFDGRTREDGLAAYLKSIDSDANESWRADRCRLKGATYDSLLYETPPRVYPDARRLLDWLNELAIPCAVASSSKAATQIMRITGLDKYFCWISNGSLPKPAVYSAAASAMGLELSDCAVFEDSAHAANLAITMGAKYVTFMRKDRA